jgi:hypothetical protein
MANRVAEVLFTIVSFALLAVAIYGAVLLRH